MTRQRKRSKMFNRWLRSTTDRRRSQGDLSEITLRDAFDGGWEAALGNERMKASARDDAQMARHFRDAGWR